MLDSHQHSHKKTSSRDIYFYFYPCDQTAVKNFLTLVAINLGNKQKKYPRSLIQDIVTLKNQFGKGIDSSAVAEGMKIIDVNESAFEDAFDWIVEKVDDDNVKQKKIKDIKICMKNLVKHYKQHGDGVTFSPDDIEDGIGKLKNVSNHRTDSLEVYFGVVLNQENFGKY